MNSLPHRFEGLALALLLLPSAGCGDSGPGSKTRSFDFEGQCAGVWPPNQCASSDCTPLPVNQDYADAFLQVLQEESGWSDRTMERHVALRFVDHWKAQQSSHHEITAHIDVDWARILYSRGAAAPGGEPEYDAILAAWREYASAPAVDPTARLALGPDEVEEAVAACEAEEGVTLDRSGWCTPWVSSDPGDDDGALRFSFFSEPLPDNETVAAYIEVTLGEIRCDRIPTSVY